MMKYILSVGFFVDGSVGRFDYSARVDLGKFSRELTNQEKQEIMYAAKVKYGQIMRRKQPAPTPSDAAGE